MSSESLWKACVCLSLAVGPAGFAGLPRSAAAQQRGNPALTPPSASDSTRFNLPSGFVVAELPLGRALEALELASGIPIAFSPTLVPLDHLVSCDCADLGTLDALEEILGGTGFEAIVVVDQLLIRRRPDAPVYAGVAVPDTVSRWPAFEPNTLTGPLPTVQGRAAGTVAGFVLDASTGRGVPGSTVRIPALGVSTLSGADGRFQFPDVPVGTHVVEASQIGRLRERRGVEVRGGFPTEVSIELVVDALELDAVVVTGTAGDTRLRAIGNVVGRVAAASVTEIAPVQTMQQLLMGREPGLTFYGSDGSVGTGRTIRIRGLSSLQLSQQPLIYVDGVRVDNDAQVGPAVLRATNASRFNDFNPDEVESIEVIKGPAAATLYGTEASAGVIQIITKRGENGDAQFDLTVRQGANWLMRPRWKVGNAYGIDPGTGALEQLNIIEREAAAGRPVFTTGPVQAYALSMRGGSELARYFLSADWHDEVGMVDYNWDERLSLRANVSLIPSDTWTFDVSTGWLDGTTSFMSQTLYDVWYSVRMSTPLSLDTRDRGFFRAPSEVTRTLEATRRYRRFTGGVAVTHAPASWFLHRLIIGSDQTADQNVFLAPRQVEPEGHWFGGLAYGEKSVELPETSTTTLDYSASATYAVGRAGPEFLFTTSFGAQYYRYLAQSVTSSGTVFPSPAITALSGLSQVFTTDEFEENVSLGLYLQQEVAWRDRVYMTLAVRGDDNSAFGSGYDAAIYPKLSATWMLSEEDFWRWRDTVNGLRLRMAWGQAGRQPATLAAVTLYSPTVALDNQSAVEPNVLGNPEVGPEVSSELETGLDFALFGDRLAGDFTYYQRNVTDVLINVPIASSVGFPGVQDQNLGKVLNRGWELRVDAKILDRPSHGLDIGFGYSHTWNRIEDLGGVPGTPTLREGFPFPAAFYVTPDVSSGEIDESGRAVGILCDYGRNVIDGYGLRGGEWKPCVGGPEPPPRLYWGPLGSAPSQASMDAALRLGDNLTLFAMAEWRGSHRIEGNDPLCRFFCYPNDRFAVEREVPVILCAVESSDVCGGGASSRTIHGANAEFAKLREVSATFRLPTGWTDSAGVESASITLAGRDLFTWQAQKCTPDHIPGFPECYGGTTVADPETRDSNQALTGGNPAGGGVTALPGLSSFVLTMRVAF